MKRSRDGKRNIPTVREKCKTKVPLLGITPPMLVECGDRRYKAGRCKEHHTDWRNASDTRRVEAAKRRAEGAPIPSEDLTPLPRPYIPKAERKYTKDPIRVRPEPKQEEA